VIECKGVLLRLGVEFCFKGVNEIVPHGVCLPLESYVIMQSYNGLVLYMLQGKVHTSHVGTQCRQSITMIGYICQLEHFKFVQSKY